MRCIGCIVAVCLGAGALAQPPVINPRGVVNAATLEPAPTRVTPGGLLLVQGINLGPVQEVKATGFPLPTELGSPPVSVLINNRPAPLISVSPTRILCQVPWETQAAPGQQGVLAAVVVRRGEQQSGAAILRVVNVLAGIRTKNDLGFGEAGTVNGTELVVPVTGLGQTDPPMTNGSPGPSDATLRTPVRVYIGGLPAASRVTPSKDSPGEYDLTVTLPADAEPGDAITIEAGNPQVNRGLYGKAAGVRVQYLPNPPGAAVQVLRSSDLRGNYVVGSGPRASDGCYPSVLFDFGRNQAARIGSCLIAAQPNAPTGVLTLNNNPSMTSFVGPASGDAQTGLSSKMIVFNPAQPEPMTVELPAAASQIGPGPDGSVLAVAPGAPPRAFSVNIETGEVAEAQVAAGGVAGAGGVPGAGGAAALLNAATDLGDGVKEPLTVPVNLNQGAFGVVVADQVDKPSKAKVALLNQQGAITGTRDFPEGWVPLTTALPPAVVGAGGALPPGGAAALVNRQRLPNAFDQTTRSWFVLARKTDGSRDGFVTFSGPQLTPALTEFPEGRFAATCRPQFPLFNLELSRRLALFSSRTAETGIRAPCPAEAFIAVSFATKAAIAVAIPGAGQVNTAGPNGDVNDYLYAVNTDAVNQQISDTLYVFDSAAGAAFRLDLPPGINGFSNIVPQPELSGLIAVATNRIAGDGGLVFFDLENERQILMPVPNGFVSVNFVGVFPNTRKVVGRANRAENAGSQFVIYDLLSQDSVIVPNPEGVAFVGQLPAQAPGGGAPGGGGGVPPGGGMPPGGGGGGAGGPAGQPAAPAQLQVISAKSGFVAAVAFNAQRQPVGVVAVRIP